MQVDNADIERANTRYLYLDIFWMSIAFAMEWYFLQVYAIRLDATPAHLGTLTSLRALMQVLGSGLTNWWLRRYDNPVAALRGPGLAYRIILYLAIALVAFLPPGQAGMSGRVDALVALAVISAIPTGLTQGVFLAMLRRSLSERQLAKVVARRTVLMDTTILVCVIGFGQLLEHLPFPVNYQIGFGLAFLASFLSWWSVQQIKLPDVPQTETQQTAAPAVNVWKHAGYVRFIVIVVAVDVAVFMAAPLGQLHLVRNLNASDTWISVFGLFEMGAGTLIMLQLDRLIARFGTGRLVTIMAFATLLQPLILGMITTLPPFIIGQITFGASWAALNVLLFNRLIEVAPPEGFPQYATVFQMAINASIFAGPLISTFMIEHDLTLPAALFVVAAARFGAGVLTWAVPRQKVALAAETREAVKAAGS
jgi:hypothetical protein